MTVKWRKGIEEDESAYLGDVEMHVFEGADGWIVDVFAGTDQQFTCVRKTKAAAKRAAEAAGRRWAMKQAKAWGLL